MKTRKGYRNLTLPEMMWFYVFNPILEPHLSMIVESRLGSEKIRHALEARSLSDQGLSQEALNHLHEHSIQVSN